MAKLMVSNIKLSGNITFSLNLKSGLTLIAGDSSTGKTMFYQKYMKKCRLENNKNVVFINNDILSSGISLKALLNVSNKLIIIDNADLLIDIDMARQIYNDGSNQYIIFGRDIGRYIVGKENIAEFKQVGNTIELKYIFMPKR